VSRIASSVDLGVYVTPTAAAVARLVESHGLDAAVGRWFWMGRRTLLTLAQQGRAVATGIAPTVRRSRSYSPEDAAVAIEASFLLGSMSRGERAAGLTPNVGRGAIFARGLVPPAISAEERGRASRLGQAANAGDVAAIGERDARRAEERAIGSVLRRALSLVPSQPATGRYRLPPCDDALRTALAGECPDAVQVVFPDLATPVPTPKETVVATLPHHRRKLPPDIQMASLHASGASITAAAEMLDVSAQTIYNVWKKLGLPTRGRWRKAAADAIVQPAASNPAEPAVAVPVVIEPAEAPAVVEPTPSAPATPGLVSVTDFTTAAEQSARLSVEDLALAADLVDSRRISAALAVEIVAADRDRIAAYRPAPATVLTPEERALAESAYVELLADWDAPEQRQ